MTKTEMLLIRACKNSNSRKRLFSVYRRFYHDIPGMPKKEKEYHLVSILNMVSEKYCPIKQTKLIESLHPDKAWMFLEDPNCKDPGFYSVLLGILISHIGLVPISSLPEDYIKPLRFRD